MRYFSIKHNLLGALGLMVLLTTGCIKEELEECYTLTLKVENVNGDDITEAGDVAATLFVFDENYNFLEERKLDNQFVASRQPITLDYPASRQLHLVAWGNEGTLDSDRQLIEKGQTIEDLRMKLISSNGLAQSPDNLYYGNKLVTTKANGGFTQREEIVIRIKTGTITMETQGLQYAIARHNLRSTAADFQYYMNRTPSQYDYRGEQIGDSVYYNPEGQWDKTNQAEWITTRANEVCYGENIAFSLQLNGQSLGEVSQDDNGDPIKITVGQDTHAIFRFGQDGTLVSVRVTVRPWGQVDDDIPLN